MPHNRYWKLNELTLENEVLRIGVTELLAIPSDVAEPITINGVEISGNPLRPRLNSKNISLKFSSITEFRVMPEVLSWPAYASEEAVIPSLLYKCSGLYFYGKIWPQDHETYHYHLGWVKVARLHCYIVHTETVDIYVLTDSLPSIFYI